MSREPLLVVLSGPSGVGKDSILGRIREQGRTFHFTVTATTRPRRAGERDGYDYYFYSEEQFDRLLQQDAFLEHACVYGRRYGVPKGPVRTALSQGQDVIMRTDVQGAATIRSRAPGALLIFISPPSLESLEQRLHRRSTESDTDLQVRLAQFRDEMATLPCFDYAVVNAEGQLDRCVSSIASIVEAEKCRVTRPALGLV